MISGFRVYGLGFRFQVLGFVTRKFRILISSDPMVSIVDLQVYPYLREPMSRP